MAEKSKQPAARGARKSENDALDKDGKIKPDKLAETRKRTAGIIFLHERGCASERPPGGMSPALRRFDGGASRRPGLVSIRFIVRRG